MTANYIIRGGAEGRRRLATLSLALKSCTEAFLDALSIPPGSRALDVGCGGGDVTQSLARRVGGRGHVTGMDLDPVAIALAREEAAQRGLDKVIFQVGDVLSLEPVRSFDLVYARFLLSHLHAPGEAIAKLLGCLRPGATLALEDVDFAGHFCHPPRASFARYVDLYQQAARRRGADACLGARLPSLLAAAGVKDIQVRSNNPAALSGPVKEIAALTLAAIAETLEAEGLTTRSALEQDIDDLKAAASDPSVFMSMPRIVQCWARVG